MLSKTILAVIAVAVLAWLAFAPRNGVTVNCSLAEFHPDLVKYRQACRGAR